MVAKVATVLGSKDINITRMNVAQNRAEADNISLMIINTGSEVNEATIAEITKIEGVKTAKYIKLTA